MQTKICPYCKKEFKTEWENKIYCCALHRYKYSYAIKAKEVFKLSSNGQRVHNEYYGITK